MKEPRQITLKNPIDPKNPTIEIYQNFEKVELWWPNCYGKQKLYTIHVDLITYDSKEFTDRNVLSRSSKSIRTGFRKIELVQDKLSDGYSFYFKVNDVPIFMKGSNYIPSDILPENGNNHERSI